MLEDLLGVYLRCAFEPNVQLFLQSQCAHRCVVVGTHAHSLHAERQAIPAPLLARRRDGQSAPTRGARRNPGHGGSGFIHRPDAEQARIHSPSDTWGAALRTSCLFGHGGRTSSSCKKRKRVTVVSQPCCALHLPGRAEGSWQEGRQEERQGICCL